MWKPMVVGTVALALAGAGLALAQQRPDARPTPPAPSTPPAPQATPAPPATPALQTAPVPQGPTPQELAAAKERNERAALESRIAALRAGLLMTPEQEKNWPAFEQAYRESIKSRAEGWRQMANWQRSDNPIENMQARAEFMIRRASAMKLLADAAMPLYSSLDQNQQRRFLSEAFPFRFGMMGHGDHGRGGRDDGPGPRWRDRDDDGRGGGMHDWHRGGGMMGPRGGGRDDEDWRDRDQRDWRDRGRGMGPRWGWRDRDDDQRPGYGYDQRGMGRSGRDYWSDRDGDGRRGGPQPGPDEERF